MNRVSAKTSLAHLEFMQWSLKKSMYCTVAKDTDTGVTTRVRGGSSRSTSKSERVVCYRVKTITIITALNDEL